ncbi:GNAT family N-acetyltransferase [Rathayibacter rathayi]|uniref:GNAT family N-acetyltransferase n=1 Tax=Rathayibacter rathayi TaxID=33887 RepID=UPI000BC3BCF1|nr:GNAT family N-acetyltransferase [Rathayibacter rathayi]AZZ50200.1 GNAT family N-acetyltransferase [Rathayibacter rathayi]MWV74513.1 GNAT family N-acetyltransferase [Rathayibacter rathayi NCPPB 2980 = VKM Ac-1601]PPF23816.1 GNAT family N-acetyltransferase [Rathayibacter rathayi]PPF43701.1 GNAT family N-acetyltransferase [Rathayibacter rathayi]PPG68695.1 GNAT family N-acetyltransferase [Rathayibacter rathayi]
MDITIRPYLECDAADTLAVFLAAIAETAAADYEPEQIIAWAGRRELPTWHAAMQARNAIVATIGDKLVGFSDVSAAGWIDMMFVSPRFLRRGVASRLLEHLLALADAAGAPDLAADVSITARPFFERHGFVVVAEQHPVRAGVKLTNYRMARRLRSPTARCHL